MDDVDAKRLWKSSEAIAVSHLESMGYNVVDLHRKVIVNNVEVSDVDVIAEKNGVMYAIEVKSGAVDLDSIKQAYINAKLMGMKPVVIGRGLADSRVEVVAKELGVEVITLPDLVVVSLNEIREAVYEAVYSALNEILVVISSCNRIEEDDLKILEAIAETDTLTNAAAKLKLSTEELASRIAGMRERYLLPKGRYQNLVLTARILTLCNRLRSKS